METTVNANMAQCIKSASKFGETTYYNICNHTQTVVAWGSADWALAFVVGAILLGLAFMLIAMPISLMRH